MADRDESPKERHNRELIELLNELRVALPGVQVLFAFLLAVPFAQGWKDVSAFQKDVFAVAFLGAGVSSALLIAPSPLHRVGWRISDKEKIVAISNHLTIAGLAALAVAITASVLLVTDYVFSRSVAVAVTILIAMLFVAVWGVLAVYLRARGEPEG
jgi:uncharacterized membrane protein (DUF4010 family)